MCFSNQYMSDICTRNNLITRNKELDFSLNLYEDTGLLSTYLSSLFFGKCYEVSVWSQLSKGQSKDELIQHRNSPFSMYTLLNSNIVFKIIALALSWIITVATLGTLYFAARHCYLKKDWIKLEEKDLKLVQIGDRFERESTTQFDFKSEFIEFNVIQAIERTHTQRFAIWGKGHTGIDFANSRNKYERDLVGGYICPHDGIEGWNKRLANPEDNHWVSHRTLNPDGTFTYHIDEYAKKFGIKQ